MGSDQPALRLGAILSPVGDFARVVEAARIADEAGFDSVGMWGHYHSLAPEWAYVSGWSAYGALAAVTERVRLVPMVLNNLHHQVGMLAKESSVLAIASRGRFELGIGGGDWPDSYRAWGEPFPSSAERVGRLVESITVLKSAWAGREFSYSGGYLSLKAACIAPVPDEPPRVVVGVGSSRAAARAVLEVADEVNVYADADVLQDVQRMVADSGRDVSVSVFFSWEWEKWPADPVGELESWRSRGVDRAFVSLGAADMAVRLEQLAPLLG